jgi:telomerase reverse transcriptase
MMAENSGTCAIPGVIPICPNRHVTTLKGLLWKQILQLLGRDGEEVMISLIVDCGIFLPLGFGRGNFYQLSGQQILV